MPAIEDKRRALAAYKACPSEYNLQALRLAHSKVQQAARRCSNNYWLQLCSQIEIAVETGNIKGMYDSINTEEICSLKVCYRCDHPGLSTADGTLGASLLWATVYSRENGVTRETLNNIECLPVLEELDREPTLAEIKMALDYLTSSKAPGKDNIPVAVL